MPGPALLADADRELDAPARLSAAAIAAFRRDGCLRVPGVLSPATLRAFEPAFSGEVIAAQPTLPPLERRSTYGRAFVQIVNLWTRSAVVERFVRSRRLARLAAQLLGCRTIALYHDQALYKEAGGGHTPWHCDQQYWPLDNPRSVTIWIPLQDVPLAMGPISFAPGSWRCEEGRDLPISDESEEHLGRLLAAQGYPERAEPVALGEATFHTGWTFHRAGENRTREARKVMTIIYMDGATRVAPPATPAQEHDRQAFFPGLAIGAPAAGTPLTPLLYDAAEDDTLG